MTATTDIILKALEKWPVAGVLSNAPRYNDATAALMLAAWVERLRGAYPNLVIEFGNNICDVYRDLAACDFGNCLGSAPTLLEAVAQAVVKAGKDGE